jgi:proline racemase
MKTAATLVAMFLFGSIASAQTQAAMTAKLHEVKQGDTLAFTVKVEPAPNVRGTVRVLAKPASGDFAINFDGVLEANGKTTDPSGVISLDAPTGKWTVTQVSFIPYSGNPKTLTVTNLPSFEVTARKVVEPDSAVVEVK